MAADPDELGRPRRLGYRGLVMDGRENRGGQRLRFDVADQPTLSKLGKFR